MGQIAQKMTLLKRWSKNVTGKTAVAVEQGSGRAYKVGQLSGYYKRFDRQGHWQYSARRERCPCQRHRRWGAGISPSPFSNTV